MLEEGPAKNDLEKARKEIPPYLRKALAISTEEEINEEPKRPDYRRATLETGKPFPRSLEEAKEKSGKTLLTTQITNQEEEEDKEEEIETGEAKKWGWSGQVSSTLENVLGKHSISGLGGKNLTKIQQRRLIGMGGLCAIFALGGICVFSGHGANHYLASSSTTETPASAVTTMTPAFLETPTSAAFPGEVASVWASGTDDPNVGHARNTALGFAQGLWTFDYRYSEEYCTRLNPFATMNIQSQILTSSKGERSHQQQLIESGEVLSLTLTVSSTHQSATAVAIVEVNVFRRNDTIDILTPTPEAGQTGIRSGYQNYRAISEVQLDLVVTNNRWLVSNYQIIPDKK